MSIAPIKDIDAHPEKTLQRVAWLRGMDSMASTTARRCSWSVLLSLSMHVVLIAGVGFYRDPSGSPKVHEQLNVVLVNAHSKALKDPKQALDALAQVTLDGGGDSAERVQATTPFARPTPDHQPRDQRPKRHEQTELKVQHWITRSDDLALESERVAQPLNTSLHPSPASFSQSQIDQTEPLNRHHQQAILSRHWQPLQHYPRRQFIGSRTKEYRFARYVEQWRAKIERVGELNYPIEAGEKKIYGQLLLSVSIRADGSLEKVELSRSSGFAVLDEAAVRIVRLAAPYPPFPAEIAKDTDIIDIIRTWRFTHSNQMQADSLD